MSSFARWRRRQRWLLRWRPRVQPVCPNPTQFLDPATGKLADNQLALSLQTVARVIAGRTALGVSRQVFFVELGGFDTHDTQA